MAQRHRFFCADLAHTSANIEGAEAHHALHVLRSEVGDEIQLLDGRGSSAQGVITEISRSRLRVDIREKTTANEKDRSLLTVAVAMPKLDRCKWMFEKLAELGVRAIVPLQAQRTNVDIRKLKLDRLHTTLVSAIKQSGQLWLPQICPSTTVVEVLKQPFAEKLIAHPYPQNDARPSIKLSGFNKRSTVLLIGPEGGFTDTEVDLARQHNVQQVAWPKGILRIETAAIAFSVLWTLQSDA